MLKMECSKCNEWIHLPFHSQASEVLCPGCTEVIPVKDVYVAAGPFTISRDVLFKNIYKYKRLVLEAEREEAEIKGKGNGLKTHEISARSIRMFILNLKELLDGCRDNVRHHIEDDVEYTINGASSVGTVVNISLTGICVEGKVVELDRLWKDIVVHLRKDVDSDPAQLHGKIVWVNNSGHMGIKFTNGDKKTHKMIEEYIKARGLFAKRRP